MLRKRLLFILGAGASNPYGLQLGFGLANELCQLTPECDLAKVLRNCAKIEANQIEAFRSEFMRSGLNSIDAFLSRRTDWAEVGKSAIAAALCVREVASNVLNIQTDDHWYRLLWNHLTAEADANPNTLPLKNVQVITFNYDRSLEFFLHESVKATFSCDDERASNVLADLKILHVYGQLGGFAPKTLNPTRSARPYNAAISPMELAIAANGIRVIPEARDDDPMFKDARAMISEAYQICILGFGFDELNMRRLGLSNGLAWLNTNSQTTRVLASVYKKTDAEIRVIRETIGQCDLPEYLDHTNSLALRNSLGFQRLWRD